MTTNRYSEDLTLSSLNWRFIPVTGSYSLLGSGLVATFVASISFELSGPCQEPEPFKI